MDNLELLKRLKNIDPQSLADAHDDVIEGFDEKGSPIVKGDPTFEIDGKIHTVPFKELRSVLKDSSFSIPKADLVALKKSPKSVVRESEVRSPEFNSKDPASEDYSDDGYYWDKNYNYEYMNPESEKQKVLGKIKK